MCWMSTFNKVFEIAVYCTHNTAHYSIADVLRSNLNLSVLIVFETNFPVGAITKGLVF